jgi:hypothetical protein
MDDLMNIHHPETVLTGQLLEIVAVELADDAFAGFLKRHEAAGLIGHGGSYAAWLS